MTRAYEWYREGLVLLSENLASEAASVLEKAANEEPEKSSIREALARAYFRSGRARAALEEFSAVLDLSPANDYAHFGVGLCLGRLGRLEEAIGHLKMANVMRPDSEDYERALRRHETQRRLRDRRDRGGATR